jgi:aspartate kinase
VIVMKFGGTSVADAERILGVCEIVGRHVAQRPVVVVSALAGVTDLLERIVALTGEGRPEPLEAPLAELERRHRWAVAGAVEGGATRHELSLVIDALFEELRGMLRSIRTLGELTARARDAILAFGETLSSRIVATALGERHVRASWIEAQQVLRTDGCHGDAAADLEATGARCEELLAPLLERGEVPVLGGFVGATSDGVTTTLGRGGSDTSAAVLGAAMAAREIQIWTDVNGLMTADPRRVREARTLSRVSFAEAAELAFYGARVLHPAALWPAVRRSIPVRVRNTLDAEAEGSLIVRATGEGAVPLAGVASRRGVRPLRITNRRLRLDPDFLPAVLEACRSERIVPDLVLSSEVAVSLLVPGTSVTGGLASRLGAGARVETGEPAALVCVVGTGLRTDAALRGRVLAAVAALDPLLVALGGAENSVAAVVPEPRLSDALGRLHREFFEEASPR